MSFILAKRLKKEFYVRGKFYNLIYDNKQIIPCRSVLEIIKKNEKEDIIQSNGKPNAIFIMMNPGGSKPKDKKYNIPHVKQCNVSMCKDLRFVETKPDITQYQIMRIMKDKNWNCVRVINLSDYREAKSSRFYNKINELDLLDKKHLNSIFSNERYEEFNTLLNENDNVKIVVAWGVNEKLKELIGEAITKPQLKERIGLCKGESNMYYYHPCPRKVINRKKWLHDINKII